MAKKKSGKKRKSLFPKLDKESKQLIWVFVIIFILFASFLVPYFYVQSLKKFELYGVDWYVENPNQGSVTFYHTVLPKLYNGEFYGNHNVYLRNDPRKNKIPTDINLSILPRVIVTYSPEVYECEDQILVATTMGQSFSLFPFVKVFEAAIANEANAKMWELPFADCTNSSNGSVFLVRMAKESSIVQEGDCYILNIGKCEDNLLVAERLVMEMVDQLDFKKA